MYADAVVTVILQIDSSSAALESKYIFYND